MQRNHASRALSVICILALTVGPAGAVPPSEPAGGAPRHVVTGSEIQAAIDRQVGREDADRQEIHLLLQRPEVQAIAGSAGLDLKRADAAAAVLSGPELAQLAARAREINKLAGGDTTIILSATTVIIILLLLILLTD